MIGRDSFVNLREADIHARFDSPGHRPTATRRLICECECVCVCSTHAGSVGVITKPAIKEHFYIAKGRGKTVMLHKFVFGHVNILAYIPQPLQRF